MVYFISGHRNITEEEFNSYYVPMLFKAVQDPESKFVVGDYYGADKMAQEWLLGYLGDGDLQRVTVFHMFEAPRNCESDLFLQSGGWGSDEERDSAMTLASDQDIAWVRSSEEWSGTKRNLERRLEINCRL